MSDLRQVPVQLLREAKDEIERRASAPGASAELLLLVRRLAHFIEVAPPPADAQQGPRPAAHPAMWVGGKIRLWDDPTGPLMAGAVPATPVYQHEVRAIAAEVFAGLKDDLVREIVALMQPPRPPAAPGAPPRDAIALLTTCWCAREAKIHPIWLDHEQAQRCPICWQAKPTPTAQETP
jgi:hypothetical protein